MRLLHTADWHLGARLIERDRLAEHATFVDWLIETLRSEKIDALLLSGDVFDAANPPQEAVAPLARAGLADLPAIADPDGSISRALGIERGSFNALLGPRTVARALPALLAGHGIGYPVGDPLQMPAAFVIHRGRVLQHQHHAYAGEPVDFRSLLGAARAAQGRSGSVPLAPAVAAAHT